MDDTQFKDYLLQRYINNQATNEELEILFNLIEKDELDDTLKKYLEIEANKVFDNYQPVRSISPVRSLWKWGVAASVMLIAAAGIYFSQNSSVKDPGVAIKRNDGTSHDIAAGGNKATLILSDGSEIILDDAKTGTLVSQGATAVIKSKEGQLLYDASQSVRNAVDVNYNTIATPRGGQYQVILPDGSKVWLNAASSIKFPTAFTGNERNVIVTGEAYFEVAKDAARPFKVNVSGTIIQVLGTHFNVMAYADEQAIRTTLLEGSVKLIHSDVSAMLKPGEEGAILANDNSIKINAADVKSAIAWKEGYFRFENADLPALMRQLSRWYDVEIEYEGKIPSYEFVGQIERSSSLSKVLEILRLSDINFKISGKKLIVSPPTTN